MLVHIVNSANREFYSDYLNEMFAQRKELFYNKMGWKELPLIDGTEKDEMDLIDEVEYLLIFDSSSNLIGHCRCNPTTKPHLLSTALKQFVQRPVNLGPDCWEFTRFAPVWDINSSKKKVALAYLCTATMEWALMKGIKRLQGIGEENLLAIAGRLGWPTKLLGMPIEYQEGKSALAFEFTVNKTALAGTRLYFGLEQHVTIQLPPLCGEKLTPEQISFIDAAMTANNIKTDIEVAA